MFDVVAIGEVMAEIRQPPGGGFSVGFAGDTYNTAVYCARALREGGRVAYMTRVGTDPLSRAFLDAAGDERLDLGCVAMTPAANIGIYTVETDAEGERSFAYWRATSAARGLFSGPDDAIPSARITYLSGITLAILPPQARRNLMARLRSLQQRGLTRIAFDSNYRPALWEDVQTARSVIGQMWDLADIALPSLDDEMNLFGVGREQAVVDRFAAGTFSACAIKRGVRGPLSPTLAPQLHPDCPQAPAVVDTTAAGDSFNGAYLAAYCAGEDESACLLAGHRMAVAVVGQSGAIIPAG